MHWADIAARIARGEDEQTELKRWDAFPTKIAEAVAALANSRGGLVIIGVADDGKITGVPGDPKDVRDKLSTLMHTALSAPVPTYLGSHTEGEQRVFWLEVPSLRGPEPLRVKGRVLVRRGSSSVEASGAELQELFNTFGLVLTEEQALTDATPASVDLEAFTAHLRRLGLEVDAEAQSTTEQDLLNRGVLVELNGERKPTLYGVMCFGRTPQAHRHTANHFIQCVAYAGTDRADEPVSVAEARGRLDEQVWRAMDWLKTLGQKERYVGVERHVDPIVPERALREALVNAVAHRDYAITGSRILFEVFSDRISVTSPGTLPNHLTESAVMAGGQARSRNELMALFLSTARLMESRARGFPVMRREMRVFNQTDVTLVNDASGRFVRVTLSR